MSNIQDDGAFNPEVKDSEPKGREEVPRKG